MSKTKTSDLSDPSSNGSSKKSTEESTTPNTSASSEESTQASSSWKGKKTHWGISGTKLEQQKFRAYLEQLTSAKEIIGKGDAGIVWLRKIPERKRIRIMKHLKTVDPDGYKELISRIRGRAQRRVQEKKGKSEVTPVEVLGKDDLIGIENSIAEVPAASSVRFVSNKGVRHVAAICLAAGYKREEVAQILGMEIGELNEMVTNEDVQAATKDVGDAVIQAADQLVLRNLLAGAVTEETQRADMISSRRKKLTLDASAEARSIVKDSEGLRKKREDYLERRFGKKENGDEGNNV
jgi:hypothetical protein